MGLLVTTSNIKAKLSAQTGERRVPGQTAPQRVQLLNSGSTVGTLLTLLGLRI
jgi:hypothetical protein